MYKVDLNSDNSFNRLMLAFLLDVDIRLLARNALKDDLMHP